MAKVKSTIIYVLLLVLITCQERTFSEGRFLRSFDKVDQKKRGTREEQDIDSRPEDTYVVKTDAVHKDDHETQLDGGKYNNVEDEQRGHSPGVGHPFVPSEDHAAVGTSIMANKRNAGGKPSNYSPGVGHSFVHYDKNVIPESVENTGPNEKHHIQEETQGPGAGHYDEHTTTDKQFKEEQLRIESHSPGVGHSIQQKHTEPRARK